MTPIIYHGAPTRSCRLVILFEELSKPYEVKAVDFLKGENRTPEYLAVSDGTGSMPTYIDEEDKILESGAAVEFILEKYAPGKLQPAVGSKERAAYLHWFWWAEGTFSPAIVTYLQHTVLFAEESRVPAIAASGKARSLQCCDLLEKQLLGGNTFTVGSELSAADIMMTHALFLTFGFAKIADASSHPKVFALFERLRSRESYKKAYGALA